MNTKTRQSIDDLIVATKILVNEHIIDGFGHVSVRDPNQFDHYFMTRDNIVKTDRDGCSDIRYRASTRHDKHVDSN